MKEIYPILIGLQRLLTEVKDSGWTYELECKIQELFTRGIPFLMEIEDVFVNA